MPGFLRAKMSESIRPPSSGDEWSYTVMQLAPEGQRVEAGAVVAKLEGENLKKRLVEVKSRVMEDRVKAESKVNELKTAIDGLKKQVGDDEKELSLVAAAGDAPAASAEWIQSARDRLIEKLDLESRQLKLTISRQKLARKEGLLATAEASNLKTESVNATSVKKIETAMEEGERKTTRSGIVVYKRSPWERRKVRIGAAVHRGSEVLAVVDDKNLYVDAFLKEEDWRFLEAGRQATVKILGRREITVPAKVARISAIVLRASDWDRSLANSHPLFQTRVFKVELELEHVPDEAKPEGEVEVEVSLE